MTYRPNVEKGAAFLDERMPGWLDRVNVHRLDLESCTTCVLGQLGGSFHDERRRLEMSADDAIEYGFNVPEMENSLVEVRAYRELTDEWRAYIKDARGVAS